MPQTGKTSKKTPSATQERFEEYYRKERLRRRKATNILTGEPVGSGKRKPGEGILSYGNFVKSPILSSPQAFAREIFGLYPSGRSIDNPNDRWTQRDMYGYGKTEMRNYNYQIPKGGTDGSRPEPLLPRSRYRDNRSGNKASLKQAARTTASQQVPLNRFRARGQGMTGLMSMGAGLGIGQLLRGMMDKEQAKRK
jgi:hypothetical protein